MKVLSWYADNFSYTIGEKNHEKAEENPESAGFDNCIVAFIQVEEEDEEQDLRSREKKLTNHIKWLTRKNKTKNVVLHSFAHLSKSKASMDFTRDIFDACQKRLENADHNVAQTPFGYFLNLNLQAPGFSMARIWAEL